MNMFVSHPFASHDAPTSIEYDVERDFSLEIAELEMVLEMKDGGDFETVARSAALSCGNDFLFTFPAARFPLPCDAAACVRIKAPDASTFAYVYRRDGRFHVACEGDLDHEFIEFAHSFATILMDLRDTLRQAA